MMAMVANDLGQFELFATASEEDIERALELLNQYIYLKNQVEDYKQYEDDINQTIYEGEKARRVEADELYANKTGNAMILALNQKRAAEECELIKKAIERAVGLIRDNDTRVAVTYRYLKGFSYKDTLLTMHRGVKSSTMDRKLKSGHACVANTLKLWGIMK